MKEWLNAECPSELMVCLSSGFVFLLFNLLGWKRQEKLMELQWNDSGYFVVQEGITLEGRTLWSLLLKAGVFFFFTHISIFWRLDCYYTIQYWNAVMYTEIMDLILSTMSKRKAGVHTLQEVYFCVCRFKLIYYISHGNSSCMEAAKFTKMDCFLFRHW
jgi:hypothetical protein